MKKLLVAIVLAAGCTAIAFAAFDTSVSSKKNVKIEKKTEMKKKKECRHTCMYQI